MSAELAEQNAERARAALIAAGYRVATRDYPATIDPEIGARHYVFVTTDGYTYSAQWHLRAVQGTSFMSNRGDGWDETTARRLSAIVAEVSR